MALTPTAWVLRHTVTLPYFIWTYVQSMNLNILCISPLKAFNKEKQSVFLHSGFLQSQNWLISLRKPLNTQLNEKPKKQALNCHCCILDCSWKERTLPWIQRDLRSQYIPGCSRVDTSLLHITALGFVLYTVHRQHTEGTFLDKIYLEEEGTCNI